MSYQQPQENERGLFGNNHHQQRTWDNPASWSTGGKIVAGAAAIGLVAFGVHEYREHERHRQETAWTANSWQQDSQNRRRALEDATNSGQELPPVHWAYAEGGYVPNNAIQTGNEADGTPLFTIRAFYNDGVHVGKLSPATGAYISWGGEAIRVQNYEVLVGYPNAVRWIPHRNTLNAPHNNHPVDGGREADGSPLFIARTQYQGGVQPGKAGPTIGDGIAFAYDRSEVYNNEFQYLALAN
ncbi:uncharacterized protein BJ171DRAFT_510310 [Polychytrium aggregatum]|uniref:uncharacterized protein n=1 Tax=Polychytrium aggregatum TaxID=110093 RepID=UPI0022FDD3E1|nr:uncharacterized protein BJ171DRAFT_510310 [Polychytrium aggregatum]KAI9203304.1 hypothetical protein BJ171DRAFT_510310 [Polychytrium aggregatum]